MSMGNRKVKWFVELANGVARIQTLAVWKPVLCYILEQDFSTLVLLALWAR